MSYKFENVTPETLKAFVSFRNPHPEEAYQHVSKIVSEGDYDFTKRWLYTKDDIVLSILVRFPVPRPIYSLRTTLDISEQDILKLLDFSEQLSEQDDLVTLNYATSNAKDISKTALNQGWTTEAHVMGFDTPLLERNDLKPDLAAKSFPLEHLKSSDFADFYKPIWTADVHEQELGAFDEEINSFSEVNTLGEVVYLYDGSTPVAAGVVDYDSVATMTLIGVLPNYRQQGWGTRLHKHLMWVAKQHVELYRGQTSTDNVAMLQLFEKNKCINVSEVWQLTAPKAK